VPASMTPLPWGDRQAVCRLRAFGLRLPPFAGMTGVLMVKIGRCGLAGRRTRRGQTDDGGMPTAGADKGEGTLRPMGLMAERR
jgi:hypothetical protein